MVVRTVKEEMGWSFNLMTATTNRIYAVLKIVSKFMISQVAQSSLILMRNFNPSLLSSLNTWLGSGLMNFSITLLKTLQEVELQILTSILFHHIITAGKNFFWKSFFLSCKKGFDFFEHFSYYWWYYFLELVEINKQVVFL